MLILVWSLSVHKHVFSKGHLALVDVIISQTINQTRPGGAGALWILPNPDVELLVGAEEELVTQILVLGREWLHRVLGVVSQAKNQALLEEVCDGGGKAGLELDVASGETDVGRLDQNMGNVHFSVCAVEVEWHELGWVVAVSIRRVQGSALDNRFEVHSSLHGVVFAK